MNKIILDFLKNLGLTDEESVLYMTLLEKGPQTILELSRQSGLDRTGVYRLVERLKEHSVVEEIEEDNKKVMRAVDVSILEFMVRKKESVVKELRENLPIIEKHFSSLEKAYQPGTNIRFFKGLDGIRQQVWNMLKAEKEGMAFACKKLNELVGDPYIAWQEEWVKKNLLHRTLYSDEYLRSEKYKTINPHIPEGIFQTKYIGSETLDINFQMDLYNDVVSIFTWHEDEIYGVEIHNQKLASFHKQLFNIVWNMGEDR